MAGARIECGRRSLGEYCHLREREFRWIVDFEGWVERRGSLITQSDSDPESVASSCFSASKQWDDFIQRIDGALFEWLCERSVPAAAPGKRFKVRNRSRDFLTAHRLCERT